MTGFGPFEAMDLCERYLGCDFVFTTSAFDPALDGHGKRQVATPEAMAELVEYAIGNSSTAEGARRIADGHPAPYRVRFFALGNEGSDGSITKDGKAHSLNEYVAKFA